MKWMMPRLLEAGQGDAYDLRNPRQDKYAKNGRPDDHDPFEVSPQGLHFPLKLGAYKLYFALKLGAHQIEIGLCGHAACDAGVDRARDGFGLRLLKPAVAQSLHLCNRIKSGLRHGLRSFSRVSSAILGAFSVEFQCARTATAIEAAPFDGTYAGARPARRGRWTVRGRVYLLALSRAIVTCGALLLPVDALAQSRPLGSSGEDPAIDALLGNCPVEALRRAWLEGGALQAAAVEKEVLALCTERAEQIRGFAEENARARTALAGPVTTITDTTITDTGQRTGPQTNMSTRPDGAARLDGTVTTLRADVEELRGRITRLEAAPERPDTEEQLDDLRRQLAVAEAALGRVQAAAPVSQRPDAPSPAPVPAPGVAAPDQARDGASGSGAEEIAGVLPEPEPASEAVPDPARVRETIAPVTNRRADIQQTLPPDRPTEWQVLHAVRAGEGPWRVQLQGGREIAISVPGATPEEPPSMRWQVITDPPVTVTLGESLPDGLILDEVTDEGVFLSDPIDRDAPPRRLPFVADPTPGVLEWDVELVDQAALPAPKTTVPPVQTVARSPSPKRCAIKGNVSNRGERIYHMPGQKYYGATRIARSKGERWFCSEAEARQAGWRKARV